MPERDDDIEITYAKFLLHDPRTGLASPAYDGELRLNERYCEKHICWWGVADVQMTADDYAKFGAETVVDIEYEKGGRTGTILLANSHPGHTTIALTGFQPMTWPSEGYLTRSLRYMMNRLLRIFG